MFAKLLLSIACAAAGANANLEKMETKVVHGLSLQQGVRFEPKASAKQQEASMSKDLQRQRKPAPIIREEKSIMGLQRSVRLEKQGASSRDQESVEAAVVEKMDEDFSFEDVSVLGLQRSVKVMRRQQPKPSAGQPSHAASRRAAAFMSKAEPQQQQQKGKDL